MSAIPRATYRVQLHRDFNFRAACAIVPYLAQLGVSHLYTSPFLKARPGSLHGYDIVDHDSLNPEIGTADDFEALVQSLKRHGMALMIDVVPNHMGVFQADNRWWLDVLENGSASRYADYFDIDWDPLSEELRGKVLLPVLGDQYGTVLERGDLKLRFDQDAGAFSLWYFEHRMPIRPSEYRQIIGNGLAELANDAAVTLKIVATLETLSESFGALRASGEAFADPAEQSEPLKRRLAALCKQHPPVLRFIEARMGALNGIAGDPASFDALHALIKAQFYRLAFWRVAADDINYRRFFDINGLAALRMERPAVFEDTHRRIFEWIATDQVQALRIDHPDGLLDPRGYFESLQGRARTLIAAPAERASGSRTADLGIYLVLEKIVADYERLPEDWPVHGTTGYRFMNVVNGLFIDGTARSRFDRLYAAFIGEQLEFDAVARAAKTLIIVHSLASDLNVLATSLTRIAKRARDTCDFTQNSIRRALVEIVACFPVYRTYATPERRSNDDRRYVDWAVGVAKRNSPAAETSVFDFVREILNGDRKARENAAQWDIDRFVGRFQQFTAPVTAKGLEDTSFYVYHPLASLNEVGGDPRRFGFSVDGFHGASADRARNWPHTMLATSTHDNKRAEDVRTRIDVLTEMPAAWRLALRRWRQINRRLRKTIDGVAAPSRNDEYLLYQTLLGAWPIEPLDDAALGAFRSRIQQYMQKAVREAKVRTSWINPNPQYEGALEAFIDGLLKPLAPNPFLQDFLVAQAHVARYGCLNSLSQVLLKLTSPGVPDLYQGTEVWDFSLVDPDNRRPVDYGRRAAMLKKLVDTFTEARDPARAARALLDQWTDGRVKLWLIWRILAWRARHAPWFETTSYIPLAVRGLRKTHICAFARAHHDGWVLSVVPRLCVALTNAQAGWPLGDAVWQDTTLVL
ncbi:MAG TPA: malto-oligosyltrehalose synthase, partial [Casimicrobiaceae bacterium]|nr:malto-oligosyltrehalose synthase [Casimicrobiaceae bacterium]